MKVLTNGDLDLNGSDRQFLKEILLAVAVTGAGGLSLEELQGSCPQCPENASEAFWQSQWDLAAETKAEALCRFKLLKKVDGCYFCTENGSYIAAEITSILQNLADVERSISRVNEHLQQMGSKG